MPTLGYGYSILFAVKNHIFFLYLLFRNSRQFFYFHTVSKIRRPCFAPPGLLTSGRVGHINFMPVSYFPAISFSLNFDNIGLIMQVLNVKEIEMTSGGVSIYDAMTGGALSRAMSGAGAAFGEGVAMGLEAGSFLGPAGAVIGAAVGAGIAYYLLTP